MLCSLSTIKTTKLIARVDYAVVKLTDLPNFSKKLIFLAIKWILVYPLQNEIAIIFLKLALRFDTLYTLLIT